MSMLSTIGGSLVAGGRGLITGGVSGAVSGIIGAMINRPASPSAPFGGMPVPGGFQGTPGGPFGNIGPAQGGFFGVTGNQPRGGPACPRGYHLNKHPLAASKRHGAVPAHSICVRNRHMNPMNY